MAQPKPSKQQRDKIEVEPGADKRLANILKKALNTPPKHVKEKHDGQRPHNARGRR